MGRKSRYQAIVSAIKRNIQHYKEMLAESSNDYEKRFYRNLLYNETLKLNYWKMYGNSRFIDEEDWERETIAPEQRKFTREELSQYNGSGGRPAYVAVNGIVYDVSIEIAWGGGTHFSLYSGKDLSGEFNRCHRGMLQVLRNLPKVGVLID